MLALMLSVASAVTIRDMRANYSSIFKTGNRNAASHLWASWILDKAADLQPSKIEELFGGFCPISGSPVVPSESNRWEYSLPTLSGDRVTGVTYHCCSPCVCDTQAGAPPPPPLSPRLPSRRLSMPPLPASHAAHPHCPCRT